MMLRVFVCVALLSATIGVPVDNMTASLCRQLESKEKKNCGAGYKYDLQTKHCYKVHWESRSWLEAQKKCVTEGANLVVIENDIEIQSIIRIYGRKSFVWTGLLDYTGKGDWISVHWQPVEDLFNTWQNLHGVKPIDGKYTCAGFNMAEDYNFNRASYCYNIYDFICEKEPTC